MSIEFNKIGERNPHLDHAHQYSTMMWNDHEHTINGVCRLMFKFNLVKLKEIHTSTIDKYCRQHGCYDEPFTE